MECTEEGRLVNSIRLIIIDFQEMNLIGNEELVLPERFVSGPWKLYAEE